MKPTMTVKGAKIYLELRERERERERERWTGIDRQASRQTNGQNKEIKKQRKITQRQR